MQQNLYLPLPTEGVQSDSLIVTGIATYVMAESSRGDLPSEDLEVTGVEFSVRRAVKIDALLAFDGHRKSWPEGTRIEVAVFDRVTTRQVSPVAVFTVTSESGRGYCELPLGETLLAEGDYTVLALASREEPGGRGCGGGAAELALSAEIEEGMASRRSRTAAGRLNGARFARRGARLFPPEEAA